MGVPHKIGTLTIYRGELTGMIMVVRCLLKFHCG